MTHPAWSAAVAPLPLTLSEADFQRTVIHFAHVQGWMCHHSRPAISRSGKWATALSGHPGLPDLILARNGVVILAELKRHGGKLTPGQRGWAAALGGYGRVWTPANWPEIVAELRGAS